MKRRLVYVVLFLGAVVFALPFVWMAATSVKVDRELFLPELRILPLAPSASPVSPYLDETYFPRPSGPRAAELSAYLEELVRHSGYKFPVTVDHQTAIRQTARGLYARLARLLPDRLWQGPRAGLQAAAKKQITSKMIGEVFDQVYRRLEIGEIHIRTDDLVEHSLDGRSLRNSTPAVAGFRASLWSYDFRKGNRAVLTRTFPVDFDLRRLQRIQLYLRPDDSWHALSLTAEYLGRRYVADSSFPLANFDWQTLTWQPSRPEDQPLRVKTWLDLGDARASPGAAKDSRQITLTLTLEKHSYLGAWWSKIKFNYGRVLAFMPFARYVRVSAFLVLANVLLTLFSCSFVAYAFARLRWPGREACFALMLATLMIPPQVTMIPTFLIWKYLGAYNTLVPLWLPSLFGTPFYIFLLRQFMLGIPKDLEDAARIDGCGFLRIYAYIILPLIKPSLAAIAIFTFLAAWNDFMGPLLYLSDQRLYPLAFGLFAFSLEAANNPALTMAASLLMTLPVIVLFFLAQRSFIQGITMTGLKG